MVNAPAAEEAFTLARDTPSLSVGLHFVLTFGRPVAPRASVEALVQDDGRFFSKNAGRLDGAPPAAIAAELEAQIERFTAETGKAPRHVDGHHHVHRIPAVRDVVIETARRLGVPVRAPDAATAETLAAAGVRSTGRFIEDFYGERSTDVASLVAILDALPDGTCELMCHPAEADPELAATSSYARERARELETLTHADVRRAIASRGIALVPSSKRV